MKKRSLLSVTLAGVIGFGGTFAFGGGASAESLSDLKSQQSKVASELSNINNSLAQKESALADLTNQLNNMQDEVKNLETQIETTNVKIKEKEQKIDKTKAEIEKLKKEIEVLKQKIEKRSDLLKERARSIQQNGGSVDYIDVLLGSEDFSDFIDRFSAVTTIVKADREIMEEQQHDKDALEEKQAKVEKNLEQLNDMLKELEGLKADLNSQKAQKNEAMKNVKAEKANIADEKKSLETEISNLNAKQLEIQGAISTEEARLAEEAKKAEEARRAAAVRVQETSNSSGNKAAPKPSSSGSSGSSKVATTYHKPSAPVGKTPAVSSGMFTRPASGAFTSGFGPRWGTMHNGIDIAAGKGTPIVAAASGSVEVSTFGSPGNWGGYGNVIIINHGNGYKTLYGHMSSRSVSAGAKVSKGQVIGAMGNTGDVSPRPSKANPNAGTHLHFEIFKNGSRVNPMGYIR